MEFEHIITLIQTVSDSALSEFSLEEGNIRIHMEKKGKKIITTSEPAADVSVAVSAEVPVPARTDSAGQQISSPLVGVFYSSASPDAEPFVQVGDKVVKGQTLGIVEAMKLMNEIESEYEGTVKEILVENEQAVEYGQPLFVIG